MCSKNCMLAGKCIQTHKQLSLLGLQINLSKITFHSNSFLNRYSSFRVTNSSLGCKVGCFEKHCSIKMVDIVFFSINRLIELKFNIICKVLRNNNKRRKIKNRFYNVSIFKIQIFHTLNSKRLNLKKQN